MEESIYKIIPVEVTVPPKQPLYRSKFPHSIPPTASTFGTFNTKITGCSNAAGNLESHQFTKNQLFCKSKTLGVSEIKKTVNTNDFLKKGSVNCGFKSSIGLSGNQSLQNLQQIQDQSTSNTNRFQYKDLENRKPSVPKHDTKPLLKSKSSRNFVMNNTIEAILSETRNKPQKEKEWMKKKGYGESPCYLKAIQTALNSQSQTQRESYLQQ